MDSVITHNRPADTQVLRSTLRGYVTRDGGSLFSAFLDNEIESFEDRLTDQPLANADYNETLLRKIIKKTGWHVESLYDMRADGVTQNIFFCKPKFQFRNAFGLH